jgi:hypothetical protein
LVRLKFPPILITLSTTTMIRMTARGCCTQTLFRYTMSIMGTGTVIRGTMTVTIMGTGVTVITDSTADMAGMRITRDMTRPATAVSQHQVLRRRL